MPPPSASASRFAAHWVAGALAGDETLDFSAIKALVGVSPESLTGAPESTRERVALRCLQEVVSVAAEGEAAAAPEEAAATAGMLRVDASRSCEDLLIEFIGEVGSSGSLEKDMLPPFSQDIQKFICIKKLALPETSLELLREVNPEITSMIPPSLVEKHGNNKHYNDQSLYNISHDHANTENLGCPTDSPQLQQENLVNETDTRNVQKGPMESTPYFHQPCTSDSRSCDHPHDDTIGDLGVSVRSPGKSPTNVDRNISVAADSASASCIASLLGSNTEPMSKQNVVDHTTMVQPQSCGDKYPDPPHYNDAERPHDDGTSIQSSKDPVHEGPTVQTTVAPDFDSSSDAVPTNTSETSHLPEIITAEDTTMIAEPHSSKTHPNSPQHDSGEKVSQDLHDGSARIQPVEKDSGHEELTLQTSGVLPSETAGVLPSETAGVLPSVSCNGAIQGDKSETDHPPENTAEHAKMLEQKSGDKSHLDVSCADTVNQDLYGDVNILKKDTVCGGQTVLEFSCCNVALHNKTSEANYLSEKNTGKNLTDIQKPCCGRSVPNSPRDGNERKAKQASNKKIAGNTVAETSHVHSSYDSFSGFAAAVLLSMTDNTPFCTQDQDANGSIEGLTEQDFCVKCGKDGQLLKCSSCLLAAHESCFGSFVAFDGSGQFYCPICFYSKATEAYQKAKKTYSEARKNLSAFLGTKQLVKQHNEQPTGVQQRAPNSEDHLNGCNTSKRQDNHQSEADNLSHKDEEPGRQSKKQKINATSDACPEDVVTEKASFGQNSDVAPMNKHRALQNNRKQVQVAEHEQSVENAEACEEAGNGNSSHETRHSSQNRCSPAANQNVEADKDDGLINSQRSKESDEIEATSSNCSGKRSSPPWRNMRHRKTIFQEKETAVSSNSITFGRQDRHMPSPSRKRNYAYPPKRYSNPAAPTGRRSKLCWTEEEEAALREAMTKFTPKDNGPIPWVQILEYGRDVFHKTRLPCDLRVKWRNMKKKPGWSQACKLTTRSVRVI